MRTFHRLLRLPGLCLACTSILASVAGAQPGPFVEGRVQDVMITVADFRAPDPDSVVWSSQPFSREDTQYLIFYFDLIEDNASVPYRLRIVDPAGRELHSVPQTAFSQASEWATPPLATRHAVIQVVADKIPRGLSFRISGLGFEERGLTALSITEPQDFEHIFQIADEPDLLRASKAVAKIIFRSGEKLLSCSGFLIDSNRLVTNEHCIARHATCRKARAIFGYERTSRDREDPGQSYPCRRVVARSHPLDAAVLQLEGEPGADGYGWLSLARRDPESHRDLAVVQHPSGEPKQVTRRRCRVIDRSAPGRAGDTDFSHRCDTKNGSSGSPVLDRTTLQVVGLHHWGFAESGEWVDKNRAVRIEQLRDFLAASQELTKGE